MSQPDELPVPNEPVTPPGSDAAALVDAMDVGPEQLEQEESPDDAAGSGGRVEPPD